MSRRCHPSRPPIPEEREVNRLHAEVVKKQKEAAEAAAERKRKRNAKHDKACKLARAEGKPRPAMPESSEEEEEEASDAEDHAPRGDEEGTSPPTVLPVGRRRGSDRGARGAEGRGGSLANLSLEGAARGSSSPTAGEESTAPQVLIHGHEAAAGEESSVLAASSHRADMRGAPSGQSSRDSSMPRARRTATKKRSMSARSG